MITRTNKHGAILITTEAADLAGLPHEGTANHTAAAPGGFCPDDETEAFFNTVLEIRERKRRMALEEQRRMRRERGLPELPPEEE
jgi:hypothetical protein